MILPLIQFFLVKYTLKGWQDSQGLLVDDKWNLNKFKINIIGINCEHPRNKNTKNMTTSLASKFKIEIAFFICRGKYCRRKVWPYVSIKHYTPELLKSICFINFQLEFHEVIFPSFTSYEDMLTKKMTEVGWEKNNLQE